MRDTLYRREQIIEEVRSKGRVRVDGLAQRFKVSTVTIRGDLNELDQRGLLVRSRGGAVASSSLAQELSVEDRHHRNHDVKALIGRRAAELIGEGDSVIIDAGTTTEEVARQLLSYSDLRVMTNGLNIASVLSRQDGVELMVCGGILRKKSQSFFGRRAEDGLRDLSFDKFLLGVDGFTLQGVTTHFEPESCLNAIMCDSANEVIAVTDSSKFGRQGMHVICNMGSLSTVVTDRGIPDDYREALDNSGVELIIVDE